jgi:hypothetical protein
MGDGVLQLAAGVLAVVAAVIGVRTAKAKQAQPLVIGSFDLGELIGFVGLMIAIFAVPLVLGLFMLGGRVILREFQEAAPPSIAVTFLARQDSAKAKEEAVRLKWDSVEPDLSAMFTAAQLIDDTEKQEQALAQVAWHSAAKGNGYFASQAVKAIADGTWRAKVLDSVLSIFAGRIASPTETNGR